MRNIFKIIFSAAILILIDNPFLLSKNIADDTTRTVQKKPLRVYTATRLTTEKPTIDGILNDSCWNTGEWAGDFTQWIPNEGAKPSQPTHLKILYDNKNIYAAIRAFDSEPEKIIRKMGRRDEFNGDVVGVNFDSYHDRRTGFEFNLTAAGQKIDLILTNPSNGDYNWNAVWYAKVGEEESAWTAEFEIPLSQLRYSSDYEQVWGMHVWRWIDRLQEESDWEVQTSTGPGLLYQFGELRGIKGLPASQRIEIMPYTLGRINTFEKERENPFKDKGRSFFGTLGLDAKIGLSSNFTANLTINPDFGQVESDPSIMNLTAFETYYEEKRPFFLEGVNIFRFNLNDSYLFYSRRIGHAPTYTPVLRQNEYMDYPDNTTILSAVKVSGKTANGFSIGVMQSLTAHEYSELSFAGVSRDIGVEPLTNYFIARIQQDFKEGNTMLGAVLTSTNRFIKDAHLEYLNRNAYTGGIDLLHYWNDKEYFVDVKLTGSTIDGSSDAMRILQNSSARYYQRPDAGHLRFDSTITRLSGYGGEFEIGKGSKGLWRYSTGISWHSPGLELNDIGYMQTADVIEQENEVSYFVNQPVSIFRTYSIGLEQVNNWDFDMSHLSSSIQLNLYMEFLNKWSLIANTKYTSQALDTRILRGGHAMLIPAVLTNYLYIKTDPSKTLCFDLTAEADISHNNSSEYFMIKPGMSIMPVNTLKLSLSVEYSDNSDNLQYVDTRYAGGANKYILGKISQQTVCAVFRIDYNVSPELSIQYYGSPFATVGKYSGFKSVTNPRAEEYSGRFISLNPVLRDQVYEVDEDGDSQVDYSYQNPDFNFSQFRSNLVFRWEYRPGSQIFFVWFQDRTNYIMPGNNSVSEVMNDITKIYPNNIFLVKFSYWFSI
ncbi:MAG: carbohydrate binding family 9 domain-containing protein [Bacteroidetes bacterium]|nr:carbohydrate binding family 9 domain-containing protein [Bacteroidota bacterium]